MTLLRYIVLLMLWGSCSAQEDCGSPVSIPTAEITGEWEKESYPHGTQATYTCRPGYIKLGRMIRECQNGIWREINPTVKCKNRPCGHPGDLLYGSFDLTRGTDFVFGARVEFQCDDGYRMISRLNYRECTATGWSNSVPHCEVVKCFPVQPPENGRIVMSGIYDHDEEYPYGHVLRFECNSPAYKLTEPNEIYCQKTGAWSGDVPKCEEISCQVPLIQNGKILSRLSSKRKYENKERIQYECNPGYKYESRGYTECSENGWNPTPACIEIVCYFQNVVNGNLQPEKNVYRENEEITLVCNPGYQPEYKNNFPICTRTGWSTPLTCVHKDCDFPEIEDGSLYYSYYTTFKQHYFPMRKGKQIDYKCDANFFTETGNYWGRIECTEEGWFPTPKCIGMCEQFRVVNGYPVDSAARFRVGERVRYTCEHGYSTLEGLASGETQCLKSGWSVQPTCIKTCTNPFLYHGRYSSNKTMFMAGDILQYECDDGYMDLERKRTGRIQCTKIGWTKKIECTEIKCSVEDEITDGFSTPPREEYKNGHVLKFSCNENYFLQGEELRQCYYFGWFPPALPACAEIICKLPERQGALYSQRKKSYNNLDVVKVSCEDGYEIIGSERIQCYYFGWYPNPPNCQEVRDKEENTDGNQNENHGDKEASKPSTFSDDGNSTNADQGISIEGCEEKCPPAPQLPNAVTVPSKDYCNGDKVSYTCKEDYQLQGKREIRCEHDKWTSPPCCTESKEKCPRPPKLAHTIVQNLNKEFYENDTVHFQCQKNFLLHGSETIQCRKGSWTSPPQCIEAQLCKAPPNIKNGKVAKPLKSRYSEGEKVIYKCDRGYHAEPSDEGTCSGGQWSTAPQCKGDSCGTPPDVENGFVQNTAKSSYEHDDKVKYKCNPDYNLVGKAEIKCSEGKWTTQPRCLDTSCGLPPSAENAKIISTRKERYKSGEKVRYHCEEGFIFHEGVLESTCKNGEWSQAPGCIMVLDTCDRPPGIDNGDIQDSRLGQYKSGQSVTYRCIKYYVMSGSPTVTCLQGRWSETPTCFEPCTATEEDMAANKIILRWEDKGKIYVPHGDQIEFQCQSLEFIEQSLHGFRITCIRGHLNYPRCIGAKSCLVSLADLVKNNLALRDENTEVKHNAAIQFMCKPGFNPEQRGNMRATCHNKWLSYPSCTSNIPNKDCGPPPIIENGENSDKLLSDYVHGLIVEYRCSRYYKLSNPNPIVCNDGEWSKPPECIEPCILNENETYKNNIQLHSSHRNEKYYAHMEFITFECKWGYRFSPSFPLLKTQCVNQTLPYPKCS